MKNDATFWVCQKAFIEKDGKVLVLNDPVEGLDYPGGKIQEGEAVDGDASSLTRALEREILEETGMEAEVGEPFAVWYSQYPVGYRNYPKAVYVVAFRCKYISGEMKLSEEHNNFRWVSRDDYKEVDDGSHYFGILEKYFA